MAPHMPFFLLPQAPPTFIPLSERRCTLFPGIPPVKLIRSESSSFLQNLLPSLHLRLHATGPRSSAILAASCSDPDTLFSTRHVTLRTYGSVCLGTKIALGFLNGRSMRRIKTADTNCRPFCSQHCYKDGQFICSGYHEDDFGTSHFFGQEIFPKRVLFRGGAEMNVLRSVRNEITATEHKFNYEGPMINEIRNLRGKSSKYSNYKLSPEAETSLLRCGLLLNDLPTQQHGHAATKTLEGYCLRVIVPHLLNVLDQPFTAYWLKSHKAQFLANDTGRTFQTFNPVLTSKDITRFGQTATPFVLPTTPVAFMHDAAMFLSATDIYNLFAGSTELETLLATIVLPPELLDNLEPVHREIYTFAVHGNSFDYFPDDSPTASYTHSLDQLWWLRTKCIKGPDFTLTLQIVESLFAHHVVLVTRKPVIPPTVNNFDLGDRVMIPNEIIPYFDQKYRSISRKTFNLCMSYVTSLKTVAPYQLKARAHVSMGTNDSAQLSDEFLAVQLATELRDLGLAYIPGAMQIFWPHHLITRLGPIRWLRLLLAAPNRFAWEKFLSSLHPPKYTARQELTDIIVGDSAGQTEILTGTFRSFTLRDAATLLIHLTNGSTGQTSSPRFFGAATPPPGLSVLLGVQLTNIGLTNLLLKSSIPRLAWKVTKSAAKFAWNYPRTAYLISPIVLIACFVAPTAARRAYRATTNFTAKLLRMTFPRSCFPVQIRRVYNSILFATAARTFQHHGSPTVFAPNLNSSKGSSQAATSFGSLVSAPKLNLSNSNFDVDPLFDFHETTPHSLCVTNILVPSLEDLKDTCPLCLSKPENKSPTPMPKINTCLFDAVAAATSTTPTHCWELFAYENPRAIRNSQNPRFLTELDAHVLALRLRIKLRIVSTDGGPSMVVGLSDSKNSHTISYSPGHFFYDGSVTAPNSSITTALPPGQPAKTPMRSRAPGKKSSSKYRGGSLSQNWLPHRANRRRAQVLVNNICSGHFGALSYSDVDKQKMKSATDVGDTREVQIAGIFGVPGSGKTYDLLKQIKAARKNTDEDFFRFVSPTNALRVANKADLELQSGEGYLAPTLEIPFTGSYAEVMILDEIGRYPPGYIDLLILMCPGIKYVIFTGDPSQSVYHCPKADHTFANTSAEIDHFAKYCVTYLQESRRFTQDVGEALGIPTIPNGLQGKLILDSLPEGKTPFLFPTDIDAATSVKLGREAHTWNGSQGLTFKRSGGAQVVVDDSAIMADDRAWFTALTRSSTSVKVLRLSKKCSLSMTSSIGRAVMAKDLNAIKSAIRAHIATHTPPKFLSGIRFAGAGISEDQAPSERYPHLAGIIPDYDYPTFSPLAAAEIDSPVPELMNPSPPSFCPETADRTCQRKSFSEKIYHSLLSLVGILLQTTRLADDREIVYKKRRTQQVNDRDGLTSLFLHHKRGDKATEKWTADSRYVHYKAKDLRPHTALGVHLFLRYVETFRQGPSDFNEDLWFQSIEYDRTSYLGKGDKAINSIAARADAHWPLNFADRFMKAQSVTKPNTIGRDAKKGAEIYSFSTATNFEFGPLARYMTVKISENCPKHVFTINEHTDADLSKIVRDQMDFSIDSRESDYEGFDTTQDYEFAIFDTLLMEPHE